MSVDVILICDCLKVVLWANQNFLPPNEIQPKAGELELKFLSSRTQLPLEITMTTNGQVKYLKL